MLKIRASIFDVPDEASSRELVSEWHEGEFWLRQCRYCNSYVSKGRGINERCEFCGSGVILWVTYGINEFIVEEEEC